MFSPKPLEWSDASTTASHRLFSISFVRSDADIFLPWHHALLILMGRVSAEPRQLVVRQT